MTSEPFDAVIVGAGFAGIGAAIQLKRLGYDDFVILDREDDLGGTWYVNHYPGLAVDVPTTTYSYFFEPNPNWSRLFSPGPRSSSTPTTSPTSTTSGGTSGSTPASRVPAGTRTPSVWRVALGRR